MATFRAVVRTRDIGGFEFPEGDVYLDKELDVADVAAVKAHADVTAAITKARATHPGSQILLKVFEEQSETIWNQEDTSLHATALASSLFWHNGTTKAAVTSFSVGEVVEEQDSAELDLGFVLYLRGTFIEERELAFTSTNDNVSAEAGEATLVTLTIGGKDVEVEAVPVTVSVGGEGETEPTFTAGTLTAAVVQEELSDKMVYGATSKALSYSGTVVAAPEDE